MEVEEHSPRAGLARPVRPPKRRSGWHQPLQAWEFDSPREESEAKGLLVCLEARRVSTAARPVVCALIPTNPLEPLWAVSQSAKLQLARRARAPSPVRLWIGELGGGGGGST